MEEQKTKEMTDRKKKIIARKRNKAIGLVILLAIAIYVIYTIYLLVKQPTNMFTIEEGQLYKEETNIGYVIRDEKVVKGENYKNGMEQIRAEGERIANGERIFRYYSTNEQNLKKKIEELDNKIQEAMRSDIDLYSSDMKLLENQIDEKIESINELTDIAKLSEYKKEISSLVTRKAKIAGDLSPKGSYLNQLIEQRRQYESQLNSGSEYVVAPMSGILSYKVDGLEEVLTTSNFDVINKEYLEKLDLKTGKMVATNEEGGKVVENFYCYIATVTSSEDAKNAKVGDRVKVRLPSNIETNATITTIAEEENEERLIIVRIEKQIEELVSYRKISFDLIWWSASGLKVPNQSIVEEDGLHYVVRNKAGYLTKLLVNVTKQGDKYSIVEPYETEALRELGFSNTEIQTYMSYRKITLYDEILISPSLEKIE